jgi:hypothetical protein
MLPLGFIQLWCSGRPLQSAHNHLLLTKIPRLVYNLYSHISLILSYSALNMRDLFPVLLNFVLLNKQTNVFYYILLYPTIC